MVDVGAHAQGEPGDMPRRELRKNAHDRRAVFLNIPYDQAFQRLYLAYIAGLTALGLVPRATVEIPTSHRRLDRILVLIRQCRFSVHDLSRVQLDRATRTPRFNMPFELGLAVAWQQIQGGHSWYLCEAVPHRIDKSLSDLNGTDPHIHDGRIRGVFAALCSAFVRQNSRPSVQQMQRIYSALRRGCPEIMSRTGAKTPYTARVFHDLIVVAQAVRGH